jgi:HrpA-like RNA helicase
LPIYNLERIILESVEESPVTIVSAATGSGKSTQIVQYLMDAGMADHRCILCIQPRRLAVWTLADRVSQELNSQNLVGHTVGGGKNIYQICVNCFKGQRKVPDGMKIHFVSTGIFLQMALKPKELASNYSVILLDELHERSIAIDISLGILKNELQRTDLKVVLMSATIDVLKFQNYFNLKDKHVIQAPGKTNFPIELKYKPCGMESHLVTAIVKSVTEIAKEHSTGDILVFMPRRQEVDKSCIAAKEKITDSHIIGLYGGITQEESEAELKKSEKRKIIFATNVAETSITFPDLKIVVDPGKERSKIYSSGSSPCLCTTNITAASAQQRSGNK